MPLSFRIVKFQAFDWVYVPNMKITAAYTFRLVSFEGEANQR